MKFGTDVIFEIYFNKSNIVITASDCSVTMSPSLLQNETMKVGIPIPDPFSQSRDWGISNPGWRRDYGIPAV